MKMTINDAQHYAETMGRMSADAIRAEHPDADLGNQDHWDGGLPAPEGINTADWIAIEDAAEMALGMSLLEIAQTAERAAWAQ